MTPDKSTLTLESLSNEHDETTEYQLMTLPVTSKYTAQILA